MAIGRVPGAALLPDLDRQGLDLRFTTNSEALVYLDFSNFRLGVNTATPNQALEVNGNVLVANGHILASANVSSNIGSITNWFNIVYANTLVSTSVFGTLQTSSQPNVTSVGQLSSLSVAGNISAGNIGTTGTLSTTGNISADGIFANTVTGTILTASQPNITNLANITLTSLVAEGNVDANIVNANTVNATGLYGTIQTTDQPYIANLGNITVDSITIGGNITISGNTSGGVINADELYEANIRVATIESTVNITGDATGSGNISNISITLVDTGVVAGIYGSADDEYTDRVPKITVDSKGRITNIANVTLTQVGNVTFTNATISTTSNLVLAPSTGYISANNSIISSLADPVGAQDAVTKGYLTSVLSSTANTLIAGDSLVSLTDTGGNSSLKITIDSNLVANVTSETSEFYNTLVVGDISVVNNTITSTGNLNLNAANAGIVRIVGGDALGIPYGNIALRPANPEVGYFRFNTESGGIEYWDGTSWTSPGLATISSEIITPDGSSNVYTLGSNATTDGVLVSINGTMQQPDTAYVVTGNSIAFTEIPQDTDIIEIRHISAGAMSVDSLVYGTTSVQLDAANVNVTGNFLPTANVTYDIGSDSLRWRDIYLAGNTINLGGARLTTNGTALNFIPAGSSTPIDLSGDTDPSAISASGSNVRVTTNYVNVSISGTNVASFSADGLFLTGGITGGLPVSNLTGTLPTNQGGTGGTTPTEALTNLLPGGAQTGYVLTTGGSGSYYWAAGSGSGGATVGQSLTTLRQSNTASSGQTVFNLVGGTTYTPGAGQLRVYINGVRQFPSAYTETSANSYTLSTGVTSGTVVFAEIDAFGSFNNFANITYASNVGNISAVGLTVQSAIDSLENNKAPLSNPVFTGVTTAGGNLVVQGNLFVNGNVTSINANNVNINDSIIYLADDNPADTLDIGFVSSFTDAVRYQHTGFVRDATDNTWKLFANVVAEPTTTVDFTNANYANLKVGNIQTVGNATVGSNLKFTHWSTYESSGKLYFAYDGVVKMSINSDGNLTVTGEVTAFGTP
jgi:hypothetical protein